MPPRGAAARGAAKATVAGVLHERICDERFGEAIAELGDDAGLGEFERARVREARRERDRAVRVPASLVRELALAESAGFEAWQVARAESDFSLFRGSSSASSRSAARRPTPSATRAASATTRCSTSTSPTCAWPGWSRCCRACATSSCRSCRRSRRSPGRTTPSCTAPIPRRRSAPSAPGWRPRSASTSSAGRLDEAAHPFASGFAPGDVRLTTRESENDLFAGLFAVLHEAGHGLYEQGLDRRRSRARSAASPPRSGCTSRSRASGRTWSAARGRSGSAISREVREAFPQQLNDVPLDAVRACGQPRRALADPRRGRRGDLPPARLPALRDRAGAGARRPRRRRPAGRLERAHAHARRRRRRPTTPSASCRTSTGRPA